MARFCRALALPPPPAAVTLPQARDLADTGPSRYDFGVGDVTKNAKVHAPSSQSVENRSKRARRGRSLTVKLSGRTMPTDQRRGCTCSSAPAHHGALQRLLDHLPRLRPGGLRTTRRASRRFRTSGMVLQASGPSRPSCSTRASAAPASPRRPRRRRSGRDSRRSRTRSNGWRDRPGASARSGGIGQGP